jgi:hypothetical protein
MQQGPISPEAEKLLALLKERAAGEPPEADQLLARHLQYKESIMLANAIQHALDRFPGNNTPLLKAQSSILPPLF